MKFRSTQVRSPEEAEQANSQVVNLRIKEAEQRSSNSQQEPQAQSPLSLPDTNRPVKGRAYQSSQTSKYLGTNHLEPLLKSLNSNLSSLEQFLNSATLEEGHVNHLGSVMRNAKSLYRKNLRLVRLVGRLYTSQGWEWKYVHADNNRQLRELRARGGYEALRQRQQERDNAE